MMALLHNAGGEGAYAFSRKECEVPKLILSVVAGLHKPGPPRTCETYAVRRAATRTRDTTRRLRASTLHDPYVYLGPLDLTRTRP